MNVLLGISNFQSCFYMTRLLGLPLAKLWFLFFNNYRICLNGWLTASFPQCGTNTGGYLWLSAASGDWAIGTV